MSTLSQDHDVLLALGAAGAPLLGEGGEARVYGMNDQQVLRLLRPGAVLADQIVRAELLGEIADASVAVPFLTPQVERVDTVNGRIVVVERRLPGRPMSEVLATVWGDERRQYLFAYLEASRLIGNMSVSRDYYGDIAASPPTRCQSYEQYLRAKLDATRERAGPLCDLIMDDVSSVPLTTEKGLVHFDFFPANVLMDDARVTAVIDFGATAMMADPRLDAWAAVAYLDPELSPNVSDQDRIEAQQWLAQNNLEADFEAARRWIASYWCFAHDDPNLRAWCQRILS